MCLAQGPQQSDTGEARTRSSSLSSQALYHWATALPCMDSTYSVSFSAPKIISSRLCCLSASCSASPPVRSITSTEELRCRSNEQCSQSHSNSSSASSQLSDRGSGDQLISSLWSNPLQWKKIFEDNLFFGMKTCIYRPPDKSAYWTIIFFISHPKHMLWVLKRTISMRRFFWASKTHV